MNNYINNKELYKEICKWKQDCYDAGYQVKIPDSIGRAIMLIAEGLSNRYNFSGYTPTWKQEMYWDGIEATIKGLYGFDEKKYNNPHAYITMACFNAFVQRIKKERKEMAIKYSYFVHNVYDEFDTDLSQIADETFIQDIYDKLNSYESSVKSSGSKKADDTGPTLDAFYELSEEDTQSFSFD
ncbi:late sigma transcription factor [Proteus phage phiP4-3]|uniref:RNA polymerase sigma-like factor n=1 Tax=Proteus phage phiP4-3 TaxID=2065203 RepID=A0A2I6PFS7_9CAUD|nr:late sigma transcription factor [Proteus phage phiP4-3]AUM58573.1 sigma factor for late transcription [Proteus phage phiP4-3]